MSAKRDEPALGKPTFWNDMRKKNGYKVKDIAETLDVPTTKVSKWFTGRYIPDDKDIKDICDLFGVDFEMGKAEFIAARDAWTPRSYTHNARTAVKSPEQKRSLGDALANCIDKDTIWEIVLKRVYGNISCSAFTSLYKISRSDNSDIDPRSILYQEVSFAEYNLICSLLARAGVGV